MTNRINSIVKLLTISFLSVLIASCGDAGSKKDTFETEAFYPEADQEWQLVRSDEFDEETLDTSYWSYQTGDGSDYGLERWGNNELQWYTDQNATVADGNLVITAKSEELVSGYPYSSSRISTQGNMDIKYGRIEARIKAPTGQGMWAAFWLLPSDSPFGGWASSGEIDIMEAVNSGTDDALLAVNIHHGFPWPLNQQLATDIDQSADDDFHTYAIEWEENEIRWFVDDTHIKTVTSDHWYSYYYDEDDPGYKLAEDAAPFNTEFHIILNLAVGGDLPGEVDDGALPGEMLVDYVRVYECAYYLEDGSGCNSKQDRSLEPADDKEPYIGSYDLYIDAAQSFSWTVDGEEYVRELLVASFWDNSGAMVLSEVAADDADHGIVIDIFTTDSGNFSITAVDTDSFTLYGMGNSSSWWQIHAAELRFDLYIDSSNTDQESSLLVKMDSGWPALGYVELSIADLPQDEWTTVSVKINDLLANSGDSALDTENVISLFVLEPTAAAHIQVDNISLSCGNPGSCGISAPVEEDEVDSGPMTLPGTWRIAPEAGALGVGPSAGDMSWWANSEADLETRSCLFDDDYIFGNDGSFINVLGDDTWIEPWQGAAEEGCGTPVFPHDGDSAGTFVFDEDTGALTISGAGSYLGLAKATNEGELTSPDGAPASITYTLTEVDSSTILLSIETGTGDGVHWTFKLVKVEDAETLPSFEGTWRLAPEASAIGVGPGAGDMSWWANSEADLETRDCLFDDDYVFGNDGSFINVLDDETWVETWQGAAEEGCATPVFPHDGGSAGTFDYDEVAG
ncbi:MAG: glycoside hydrolase family 16 protein, partial [Gammaproteobacteria bacterium]|nr:glycoside hydrolase family 16 protein [Gammaproteobacteria bacterium]